MLVRLTLRKCQGQFIMILVYFTDVLYSLQYYPIVPYHQSYLFIVIIFCVIH